MPDSTGHTHSTEPYRRAGPPATGAGYRDPAQPLQRRVEDLLQRMTLEEKIAQLQCGWPMCYGYAVRDGRVTLNPELEATLAPATLGQFAALLRTDPWFGIPVERALDRRQGAELVNAVQRYAREHGRLGIPVLVGDDGQHAQLGVDCTIFPALCGMGCTFNPELQERMARAMACEMRAQGLTVLFAPDLDVIRDPRYGRCEENFGEDPYLVGQMGRAMVRGLQGTDLSDLNSDHTVVALLRAYPGMGDAEGGHDFTRMGLGRREMQEVVLRPWREAIEEGAQGVMAERAEYDGDPAPASTYYLNDLLRDEWGFEGITIGDAGAVRYLISQRVAADKAQAAAAALRAGLDQNLSDVGVADHSRGDLAYGEGLPQALERGLITSEEIDRSVRRVLRLKFLLGLFENPYVDPEHAVKVARCAEHRAVSLEAARQSIVLLKNDDGTLPLAAGAGSIAVIGPNADDDWAQIGDQAPTHRREDVVTILDGIEARAAADGIAVHYAPGCAIRDPSRAGFEAAVAAANASDVIVAVVGDSCRIRYPRAGETNGARSDNTDCGEHVARATLDLSGVQEQLLQALHATGKPLVVVLIHGRPLSINWIAQHAAAVVDAWYPGDQGGTAVAEVLFGDYNPGGRLAVSIPRHVGQIPVYYYHRHGSQRYVEMDGSPLYPFGWGLSYTTFAYRGVRLEPATIAVGESTEVVVEVANTGAVAGDEVVQLYVRDELCSVVRPDRELKGFRRVRLEPGATQTVRLSLGPDQLCCYGADERWVVEPGTFTVMVGGSSTDLPLTATLEVR